MRHYGILSSRNKRKELNLAKAYFRMELWEVLKIDGVEIAETKLGVKPTTCKACGGELEVIAVLHGQRGPPSQRRSANLNFEVQCMEEYSANVPGCRESVGKIAFDKSAVSKKQNAKAAT
jgi:hypothetical protein